MVVPFSIAFKRGQQNLKTVSQCIQIASKRFVKRKYPINREEEKNLPSKFMNSQWLLINFIIEYKF